MNIKTLRMYDLISWNGLKYSVAKPLRDEPHTDHLCVEFVDKKNSTAGWENTGSHSHYTPGYVARYTKRFTHINENQADSVTLVKAEPVTPGKEDEKYLFLDISTLK